MTDIGALKSANAKRWANAKPTRNLAAAAKSLVADKPRYQAVEANTDLRTLRGSSSEDRRDHQAMIEMRGEYIRAVVAETLAEQQRVHQDDIDAVVLKTVATILTSFGIEEEDRQDRLPSVETMLQTVPDLAAVLASA